MLPLSLEEEEEGGGGLFGGRGSRARSDAARSPTSRDGGSAVPRARTRVPRGGSTPTSWARRWAFCSRFASGSRRSSRRHSCTEAPRRERRRRGRERPSEQRENRRSRGFRGAAAGAAAPRRRSSRRGRTRRAVSAADTKIGVEVYYTPGDEGATFDDGAAFFSGAAFDGASDGDILVRDCGAKRPRPSGRSRPAARRAGYARDTPRRSARSRGKPSEGGSAALTSRGGVPGGDASRRSLDASEEAATRRRALRAAVALAHRTCAAPRRRDARARRRR